MNFWAPQHSPPLRVGIIGAGKMGYWHGRAARHLGAEIIAIVDPDEDGANALARTLRVNMVASDVTMLLQESFVDAVHICSPASSHFEIAGRAIESGIHALVEKPLAETAEQTRWLIDLAGRKSVVLCPVHQMTFQNGMTVAAQALGGLGDLSSIDFMICSAGGTTRTEQELDEIVCDILPHPLSILRKLWPHASWEPRHWFASRPRPGDLLVGGEYAGALLSLRISMHARPTCFEMTICGRNGSVQLDFFHGFAVRYDGGASRLRKITRPFTTALKQFGTASKNLLGRGIRGEMAYPGLRSLTRAFYAAARGESPPPIPPEDTLAVAAAADTILIGAIPTLQRAHGKVRIAGEKSVQ
jgi:predicted dehydrogenase